MAIPKAKVDRIAHRERIAAMGTSKNEKKDDGGLPWYVGDPDPTDNKVIEKIVYWFPYYAVYGKGKLQSANEEEKRIARTFLACCEYGSVVRNYFKENANHIDNKEARDIADRALDLVDEFYDWFQNNEQDLESHNKLSWSWRKEFRRFNMCMPSGGQQGEQVEPTIQQRFEFRAGQVLFDSKDLNVKTGFTQGVLKTLVENFGLVVTFKELDTGVESSDKEASVQLREAIRYLNKRLKNFPVKVENRRGYGYVMSPRD